MNHFVFVECQFLLLKELLSKTIIFCQNVSSFRLLNIYQILCIIKSLTSEYFFRYNHNMENKQKEKKVVIVTGASSGIGLALAKMLLKNNYIVYGLDRNEHIDEFETLICDLTNYDRVKECFEQIYQKEGHIDILVNNAGMGISGAVEFIEMDRRKKLFEVNMFAAVNCSKMIIPYFKKNGGGKILNTSSLAGVIPLPFQTDYSMSKAAINSFTMCLRNELKPLNIKVCAVMPGDTKTGFTANREKQNKSDGYSDRVKKSVSKMEKDETHGASPEKVAKVMLKQIKRKNPPAIVSVGFCAKLVAFLEKILPRKLMLWIVGKIYG